MTILPRTIVTMLLASTSAAGIATETTTYTYDAKGRLVKVVKSGSVNNGTTSEYLHDKTDNRVRVKTTGAAS